MSFRSERFNRSMLSLETTTVDPAKDRNRSDDGLGVKRMIEALDYDSDAARCRVYEETREEKLFEAEMRLADAGNGHLISVLLLIVENGKDRGSSIDKLTTTSKTRNAARKKYFEHRDALLDFFQK